VDWESTPVQRFPSGVEALLATVFSGKTDTVSILGTSCYYSIEKPSMLAYTYLVLNIQILFAKLFHFFQYNSNFSAGDEIHVINVQTIHYTGIFLVCWVDLIDLL